MKKALFAALSFMLVAFALVNGTFAMPDLNQVFADLTAYLGEALGQPEAGGAGTAVHVSLVSESTPQKLYPGGEASRTTAVRNEGEGNVYFRLVYAMQYEAESWDGLTIRFTPGAGFMESEWQDITIAGTPYRMKVFTYTEALPAGATSPEVGISIAMDASITSEQLARYRSDFLQMQVLAIDPTPFAEKGYTTAVDALNLALPLDTLNPF